MLQPSPGQALGDFRTVRSFVSDAAVGASYRPEGKGPFPAVVYNHGSAEGMISKTGFDALGPVL